MGLGDLAGVIDEVSIGVDPVEIATAFALRDRLDAKIAEAVAAFDRAELWDEDGSVSMAAWLRANAGRTQRDAQRTATTARRLRALPGVAEAFASGSISGGVVDAIVGIVTERTLDLFARCERTMLSEIAGRPMHEVLRHLREWQAHAEAWLDSQDDAPPPEEPKRSLHLSPTLDGCGQLDAALDPEAYALARTALRLAAGKLAFGDEAKSPAEVRADALTDIFRWFLDHQDERTGARHRPHLNVIVTLEDLLGGGHAHTVDGITLDAAALRTLACDAGIHRVITDGRSSILDYGRTTRTIPPPLYTSLVIRDLGCRWPGCDRPADWCEAHHVVPWQHGGRTDLTNTALLCSRHHHRAHATGWQLKLLPSGVVEVTAPDGRVRTSRPRTG